MPNDLINPDRPTLGQSLITVKDSASAVENPIREASRSWLLKSPSKDTRSNYERDLNQFLVFCGFSPAETGKLPAIRPGHVAAWRDHLLQLGLTNSTVLRKMTVLRSLFSYLQNYGYVGTNPAHSDFVDAPAAPRDGKTVGLTPQDCRRLIDAPSETTPSGIRDRALLGVFAYTGCRVGELAPLKVGAYKSDGVHRVLEIRGKGGKERRVAIHPEAAERLEAWLEVAGIRDQLTGPLFRPAIAARDHGLSGFALRSMSRRAVQKLVDRFVGRLKLDPNVTVHSLRVTALTTAREQGSDIIDLQDFAGHADPRTTLTYIRNRDRLSKSPAYVLKY